MDVRFRFGRWGIILYEQRGSDIIAVYSYDNENEHFAWDYIVVSVRFRKQIEGTSQRRRQC